MKNYFTLLLMLFSVSAFSQIRGTVTDDKGATLPLVNIYVENTYMSTTSNDQGKYDLNIKKPGRYSVLFQFLGFKTQRREINVETLPYQLDVSMPEESFALQEVIINPKDNPADRIMRSAIANKKANSEKTSRYKADFYSRGIFRIKDAPKSVLGQKLDMFDEVLDSTRSGILYLSETVSKVVYQKPDKLKETIIASKVSGNDNGFSFNNAASANFDVYDNNMPFYVNIVSPISTEAFNYYKFHLEATFTDENNHLINKIKVTPKRALEPVTSGYIYIVDDSFAVYACDLDITGQSMQNPAINLLTLKQTFTFNVQNNLWVKTAQTIDLKAGLLGINVDGRFTYVFNNFEFQEKFEKNTFSREVLTVVEGANKKDDKFWETIRPIPLTVEETNDYIKKDILQTKKKSRAYLDSIDAKSNKFGFMSPITGYTFKNSYREWQLSYDGIAKGFSFNTVQGYTFKTGLNWLKNREEKRTFTSAGVNFTYGLAEQKLRSTFSFSHLFNRTNDAAIRVSGGSMAAQFNASNPIGPVVNSISTMFFNDNYMKLYERNFANATYSMEVVNGIVLTGMLDYSERKPLWNNTDYTVFPDNPGYTSNNPLAPDDFVTPAIVKHNVFKTGLYAKIVFAQEYWTRPDGKVKIGNDLYPTINLGWEKGFGNENRYSFDHISGNLRYERTLGNKGSFETIVKAGKFFNADDISVVDYKHFNGNQTHIGKNDRYLYGFNLLPYYEQSTNDSYLEIHAEHNDKGYIMNKIPLLNKLRSTLVLGYHNLCVPERNPYHEFSVGLDNLGVGKFRLIRIDYFRAYQHGFVTDGFVFGLKFLNLFE
ncbi:carboxypeptidase-like regulatory domain-containing protein [Flavobacterium sp. MAH-1]|uniref:Carboxypeptidase-like regulatory domain-containing protein n=1 Tax=Flavobacterium agri TaxID=2743471 RepID=A0A7Y8Y3U1_9FLAO|nr:DUF5686 and carboxypeptidase regulatory-like domain-containing protein [Flavobacterium agri]NUY82065.1 carboxypeptidase-like regulatory domain-containing protein [Flavobacterium agri]NYA72089.1 carboxypeptidase-like regulatory domain-containing protein [Flavobacterium agri]